MKPLKTELEDPETLRQLGSASVQIVHDIKNQLNGLKLYATFLRKRLEKSDRPPDELETVGKLIAGLERAATEMNVLVRLGRPLELRRQPRADLARLLAEAADGVVVMEAADGPYEGEFDPAFLTDAFKNITAATVASAGQDKSDGARAPEVRLRREETGASGDGATASAVVEWSGFPAPVAGAAADGASLFDSYAGSQGLKMALAAKVIRAHGGEVAEEHGLLRARLPLAR
jgi:nitrogen fixation/metabolism regulation signal transduction histidine kinase